jgi:hypothetical protein
MVTLLTEFMESNAESFIELLGDRLSRRDFSISGDNIPQPIPPQSIPRPPSPPAGFHEPQLPTALSVESSDEYSSDYSSHSPRRTKHRKSHQHHHRNRHQHKHRRPSADSDEQIPKYIHSLEKSHSIDTTRPRYILCIPGLSENLNSISQIWKEFCRFGEILAIQEHRDKGYALIELADLYSAYEIVNCKRRFFSNEFVRPFFAVDIDERELESAAQEHQRKKAAAIKRNSDAQRFLDDCGKRSGDDEVDEEGLLDEMIETVQKKLSEYESGDERIKSVLREEIDTLNEMIDVLAKDILHLI